MIQIAFYEINPFSMKNIFTKRHLHSQYVREELAELNSIRKEFRGSEHRRRENTELLSDDDV